MDICTGYTFIGASLTIHEVLRLMIGALALAAMGVWARFALRKPRWKYIAIGVESWIGHVAVFELVVTFGNMFPLELNIWSAIIRMQGLVLLIAAALIMAEDSHA